MIDYQGLLGRLEEAGLTWQAIEASAHVSSATLGKIRKNQPVSLSTVQKLADLLDHTIQISIEPESASSRKKARLQNRP